MCIRDRHKKDRGKGHEMDKEIGDYGTANVSENVAGLELLLPEPKPEVEEDDDDEKFDLESGEESDEEESGEEDEEEESGEEEEETKEGAPAEDVDESAEKKRKLDEFVGDRILTEADFRNIRRKQLMQQVQKARGANKIQGLNKRKMEELEAMEDEELEEEAGEDEDKSSIAKVDPSELHGWHKKKKLTKAERVACIMEGREGREKFGRVNKKGGGSTNKVKNKQKSLMMKLQSSQVQAKSKRSSKVSTAVKAQHRASQRSKARTKRNDARSKKKK
eukprot:TRINITY_DN13235_c0_g1_i2.p1 TRINITY_DN13235_c0_g1~~TRINITY_DN13235_c0_g1_i2.p1  ORF type:complete len:277 (+),score=103.72 TRINITY_DN13235_c0_g1_i2:87-917(+)